MYFMIDWMIFHMSHWMIFTSFINNLSHKQHSCECEGLAEMKRYFCKCHICNFFCLHEHSWCESSNFVLEWRNFHKNHIRISFGLQICHLSIEFSTGITFMISLSLMDNLDKIHQACSFSDIFSTWNTFVISLSSMNSHNVLI